jgi:hypothetical protein
MSVDEVLKTESNESKKCSNKNPTTTLEDPKPSIHMIKIVTGWIKGGKFSIFTRTNHRSFSPQSSYSTQLK